MLRIAVQSKGRLYDETMMLLEEAGIKLNRGKRILLLSAKGFPVEVLFLRDDDIPQSVANGVADIGIVGENEYVEKGQEAKLIKRLGFSKCRLSLAIPKDEEYKGAEWFEGKTIATSYPVILRSFLEERGVKADIHVISGSVEIAPGIGLADAIFDIVSSGSTLVSNQLREVEVVLPCEALLIANNNLSKEKLEILDELLFRFEAIQVAEGKKYVLLNAPNDFSLPKMLLGDHGLNRDPFIVCQRRYGRALHTGKHLDNLIQLFFRSVQQHVRYWTRYASRVTLP